MKRVKVTYVGSEVYGSTDPGASHRSIVLACDESAYVSEEKAAQLQVLASGLGPLTPIRAETIERTRGQFSGDGMIEWGRKHWASMLRMVERTQPDFRD